MDEKRLHVSVSWGTLFRIVVVLALVVAVYILRDIVLVILTSVVLASAIEPATKWLMKYRFPRAIAVITLFVVFFALFAGLFYFFLPPLLDDLSGFVSNAPDYLESFSLSENRFFGGEGIIDGLSGTSVSPKEMVTELRSAFFGFTDSVFHGVNIIFGGILSFILIIIISFYLAVQERGIENFLRIVTPVAYEQYMVNLWSRTERKIGLWMQGQLILGLLIGIFVYLGLAILNVPYALLLAVLAAFFELIPLFGPILAAVPAVILAFVNLGPTIGLTVLGFYIIMQQFENHLIYPLVVRKVVGVPPLLVILSMLIFGKLFGFLGILISVPIVTFLLEIADDIERNKKKLAASA